MRNRIMLALMMAALMAALCVVAAAADASGHVVQPGETLASIAARYGVSAAALARANGISNPNYIRIGQVLVIPGSSSSGGATGGATTAGVYTVRAGDTLGSIAARYGVSTAALAAANGIANPNRIYIGMKLKIPGGSSGGATGPAQPGGSSTRFIADLSAQHCWLYQGGALTGDWPCSSGRAGSRTLTGTFKVQSKIRNAWGSAWNFWMPYWLGIYWAGKTENGIHGLPYNGARKTWAGMVGTPITFGCIMLDDANARRLWEVAYIGMPVIIQP